jgi:methylated-DNA-protein-cysteine methyltransferase-like protein
VNDKKLTKLLQNGVEGSVEGQRVVPHTGGYRLIWPIVAAIPVGRVATYGQIAQLAGLPRRARLVGYALHYSPDNLPLPWHRVINARGMLSFPPESDQYREQWARLRAEGIEFTGQRVDLRRFGWRPTLDELLWRSPNGLLPFACAGELG